MRTGEEARRGEEGSVHLNHGCLSQMQVFDYKWAKPVNHIQPFVYSSIHPSSSTSPKVGCSSSRKNVVFYTFCLLPRGGSGGIPRQDEI